MIDTGEIRALLEEEIRLGTFPGAACYFGIRKRWSGGAYAGRQTYCPESRPVGAAQTVWDLASLTKVVATTTLAMRAWDRGRLDLDRPVAETLPGFGANGKDRITPRQLLLHEAGLVAFRPYHRTTRHREDVLKAIDAEGLEYEPGTKSVYSDLSMIVLARLIEALEGKPLARLFRQEIANPLDLGTTGYYDATDPSPSANETTMRTRLPRANAMPTESVEPWRRDLRRALYGDLGSAARFGDHPDFIQGEVHDPTAAVLGGVAGHAGLFADLMDLVAFVENLMAEKPQIVSRAAVDLFTRRGSDRSTRALGWDTKSTTGSSAGTRFGPLSFGHTGYTGTSIWIDPEVGRFIILLSNRVHPTSENDRILAFRPRFHDAVWAFLDRSS